MTRTSRTATVLAIVAVIAVGGILQVPAATEAAYTDTSNSAFPADNARLLQLTPAPESNNMPTAMQGKTISVAGGDSYASVAVDTQNNWYAWGSNANGEFSIPAGLSGKQIKQIAGGNGHLLALTTEGKVFAWGLNSMGQATVPAAVNAKTIVQVSAGSSFSMALTSEGNLIGWGENRYGELDIPSEIKGKFISQFVAGSWHVMAVTQDNALSVWGASNPTQNVKTLPESADWGRTIVGLAANYQVCAVIFENGAVLQWGTAAGGQIVNPAGLAGKRVKQVKQTQGASIFLTDDGQVFRSGSSSPTIPSTISGKFIDQLFGTYRGVLFLESATR
ncbi:RCC1 domain-containing protein [Lysinibacter cavernae]|uniref:Alpha-tubulin suppressor-like RCC1 family protein n=1 Tax=Lysinibacter cavernae TaxID=1640652 RepID=A0A7X5R0N4_9MICO|nr:hypothetical protein [Lysinibacter cavernae]NIH53519.1 alpha-tubulin suppressor-like RCC1 family protein [Lysinibacter cavernae]